MEYLKQLAGYVWGAKTPTKPPMPALVAFCQSCVITEAKTDVIYIGKSGKTYCTEGCCRKHGDELESIYNRKTRKIEWVS